MTKVGRCVAAAKAVGSESDLIAEGLAKILGAAKADHQGNILDREFRSDQQFLGPFDADANEFLPGRAAEVSQELPFQGGPRDGDGFKNFVNGDAVAGTLMNQVQGSFVRAMAF
jgi:hypothetical protein